MSLKSLLNFTAFKPGIMNPRYNLHYRLTSNGYKQALSCNIGKDSNTLTLFQLGKQGPTIAEASDKIVVEAGHDDEMISYISEFTSRNKILPIVLYLTPSDTVFSQIEDIRKLNPYEIAEQHIDNPKRFFSNDEFDGKSCQVLKIDKSAFAYYCNRKVLRAEEKRILDIDQTEIVSLSLTHWDIAQYLFVDQQVQQDCDLVVTLCHNVACIYCFHEGRVLDSLPVSIEKSREERAQILTVSIGEFIQKSLHNVDSPNIKFFYTTSKDIYMDTYTEALYEEFNASIQFENIADKIMGYRLHPEKGNVDE